MKSSEALSVFRAEFLRCCEALSLTDYDITIKSKRLRGAVAEIAPDVPASMVTVRVNSGLDKDEQEWRRAARHEAVHLLTARLKWLADSRYATEDEIDREYERLAVIGEKLRLVRW